jgi:hypothetical protein
VIAFKETKISLIAILAIFAVMTCGQDETNDSKQLPLDGFGEISGECGVLDDQEWSVSQSFIFRNSIDFGSLVYDSNLLSAGGLKILTDDNAGGSSLHSEIFAYEVLYRCELAELLKTEMEIEYSSPDSKMMDFLVQIDDRYVGVSVTRAFNYPPTDPCTVDKIQGLLEGKFSDILLSTPVDQPANNWVRAIMHVIAYNDQCADIVEAAYLNLTADILDQTILMVTVTNGKDNFIY